MLTLGLYNSVRNWWSTSPPIDEPHSVIHNEEDLDEIIAAISDEPPQEEIDLIESRPIVSENESLKCQERIGYVTSISTNTGMIDDRFVFNLDDNQDAQLRVGSKVTYLVYRLGENEDWRVKNIIMFHEENWDVDPDGTANDSNAEEPVIGEGELISEAAALEKTIVTQVLRREGRIVVCADSIRVDLNITIATFTPFVGDWVALKSYVQVSEDAANLSGEILEIVEIAPVRQRRLECRVTGWDPNSRSGTVDNNVFFQKELCAPGYVPSRGDMVVVHAIESAYGGLKWRAVSVEPQIAFGKPLINIDNTECNELEDRNLFKDKNGVTLTKNLDFGTIDIDVRRVLELVIENGSTKPVRVKSIRIVNSRSKQMTLTQMPALPRDLNGGALMRVNISCLGKYVGFHSEVVVVEFDCFKIARKVFCEVKPPFMETPLMHQGSRERTRYNYLANRQECSKSQRRFLENESRSVPGVPLSKAPAFVSFRIPSYHVPTYIWDILETPKYEIRERIMDETPIFQRELCPENYVRRYQFVLHLAEGDATLDLRRYDMNRVKFVPRGEYLSLTVPGLAESRPSLLPGDKVEAFSVTFGGSSFQGVIHKTSQSDVYLKFDPSFHAHYVGDDYSVKFVQSRGYWKKCHYGVNKAIQSLGALWLFPTSVNGKEPQIEFEEVDDRLPPAASPLDPDADSPVKKTEEDASLKTKTDPPPKKTDEDTSSEAKTDPPKAGPRSSDEERHQASSSGESRSFESYDSSSSDDGYMKRGTRPSKKNGQLSRLLSMISEDVAGGNSKSSKEHSDSDSTSLTASDVERSKSKGSDSESEVKKTVKRSRRDCVRIALQLRANGGSPPVQNGTSPTTNSQSSSPADSNSSVSGQTTPTSSLNSSPAVPNSSVGLTTPTSAHNSSPRTPNSATIGQTTPKQAQNGFASGQKSLSNGQLSSPNSANGKESSVDEGSMIVERSGSGRRPLRWLNQRLNSRQKDAVRNVLRGEARPLPYIIFGPPGTGKTMTLVETILQIYMLIPDSRILIATPSNSSADLIAERLLDSKILKPGDMVRLIAFSRLDGEKLPPRLLPYCALVDINTNSPADPELVGNIPSLSAQGVGRHRVTVATCLTSGQLIFLDLPRDHFTHVIMDEAGQATEPEAMVALGFLSRAKGQAVLAGDPLQLGPVVPSKIAEEFGLGTSFLARLLRRFPYNRDLEGFPNTGGYDPRLVTKLIYNYRSIPSILRICSDMFYDSELIPTIDGVKSAEARILALLASHVEKPIPHFGVVFEGVVGKDEQEEDCPSWCNYDEAYTVLQYVGALTKHIQPEDIGVITPYRKQVQKLRQILEYHNVPIPKIATVEEFQGQERLVIIVSTVRSTRQIVKADQKHHLGFVSSPQRLNVAISRAKSLLIVIGNPHLLSYDTYWKNLLKYCCENDSYVGCNLPACLRQVE